MGLWDKLYEPSLIVLILYLVPILLYLGLKRHISRKNPNLVGLRVIEELPGQISIRLNHLGNLFGIIESGLVKRRIIMDLNSMESKSRIHVLDLLRLAENSSNCEISDLGDNVYSVQEIILRKLYEDGISSKAPRKRSS